MPELRSAHFRTGFAVLLDRPRSLANRELAQQLWQDYGKHFRYRDLNPARLLETLAAHSLSNPAKCAFAIIFKIAARSALPLEMRLGRRIDLDLLAGKAKEISEAHPEVFNPDLATLPYHYINSETFIDWATRSLDLHDGVTLKNGENYVVCDIIDANMDPFYKVEGVSNRGGFLIVPDRSEPEIHFEGLTFPGEKTVARLRHHDPESQISVYEVIGDEYDLEMQRAAREGVRPLCRNIRSYGMVKLLEDRDASVLDSPPGNFGTTTLTGNYLWAETFEPPFDVPGFPKKGYRPGSEEQKHDPFNRFVFVVFPGEGIKFTPMLRSGIIFEDFDYQEYQTDNPIKYRDSLLVTGEEEYKCILGKKASSRTEALRILGRSEEDQQVFENMAYEESYYVTRGTEVPIGRTAGYALNELYMRLLLLRGNYPLDRGLLFHLFQPAASSVQLFGTFNGWAGTSMQRDASGLWWSVAPNIAPDSTVLFKFRIEHPDGGVEWERGVNPVNRDPYGNARRWVTGTETLFSRELSLARLQTLTLIK